MVHIKILHILEQINKDRHRTEIATRIYVLFFGSMFLLLYYLLVDYWPRFLIFLPLIH